MPQYVIAVDGLAELLEVELGDLSELHSEAHLGGVMFVKIGDWLIARDRIIGMGPKDERGLPLLLN